MQEAHSPQGAHNEHCDRLSAINAPWQSRERTGDWQPCVLLHLVAGVAVQDWQSFFERTGKETIRQEAGAQHCLGRGLKCLKGTHEISLVGLFGSPLTHFLFWLLGIAESDWLASAGWLWRSDQASVPQEGRQLALLGCEISEEMKLLPSTGVTPVASYVAWGCLNTGQDHQENCPQV